MIKYFKSKADFLLRYNWLFKKMLSEASKNLEEDYDVLSQRQNDRFIQLVHYAAKRSRFYRALYAKYGVDLQTIKSIDDLHKLPIIKKEDIRDQVNELRIGSRFFKTKGYTSGTSGSPLVVYRDYHCVLEEGAYIWAQRARVGYQPGMKTVSMRGDLARNKLYRYDAPSNTLYLSSYNLSEKNARLFLDKIAEFSPYALLAYPSSVDILATFANSMNKDVHIPYIFTSSETLYDFQRKKFEQVFGSNVQDWYGNAERTIALMQNQKGGYDELPLYSVNEYQSDSTITTGLINKSFPLIRYQIGDIIIPEKYRVSYQERISIKKINGRDDDVLYLPDGTQVGRLDVIFKGLKNIDFAQFEQTNRESFILNIVPNSSFSQEDEKELISNLRARVGDDASYMVNRVSKEDIKLSKSGKYKLVFNYISNNQPLQREKTSSSIY